MRVITLDGFPQAGKTRSGSAMAEELSSEFAVHFGTAGSFFRTVTAAVIEELGQENEARIVASETKLDDAICAVLEKDIVHDTRRDWGNLCRPAISNLVPVVSKRQTVQKAGQGWYQRTAKNAEDSGTEILIVDGRNPRARLLDWMNEGKGESVLDLFITCSVEEAARRSLAASSDCKPTQQELSTECASILKRRQLDMTREHRPLQLPIYPVEFVPEFDDVVHVVDSSNKLANGDGIPKTILFETTYVAKQDMTCQAISLAKAALSLVD